MDSKDQPDEAEVLRPKKQQQADAVKVDQESLTGDMSVMFQRPAAAPEVDPVRARLGQLPSSNSPEPQLSASVVAELEQRSFMQPGATLTSTPVALPGAGDMSSSELYYSAMESLTPTLPSPAAAMGFLEPCQQEDVNSQEFGEGAAAGSTVPDLEVTPATPTRPRSPEQVEASALPEIITPASPSKQQMMVKTPGAPKTSPKTKKCTPIKPAAGTKTTSAKVVPVSSAATNKVGPPTSAARNLRAKTPKTGQSQLVKKVPINKPEPTLPKSRVVKENGSAKDAEKSKPTESERNLGAISKVRPASGVSKKPAVTAPTRAPSSASSTSSAARVPRPASSTTSSTASSTSSRVKAASVHSRPATAAAVSREKPTPSTAKTGVTGGKTNSAGTGRAAPTVLRAQSSTTATKPSAAAERVAAARAAAKALKPNAGKVKLAGGSKKMKDTSMSSSDKNGAAVEISAADNNEEKENSNGDGANYESEVADRAVVGASAGLPEIGPNHVLSEIENSSEC